MATTDLTNQVFGRLTATSLHPERAKDRSTMWVCDCECGSVAVVLSPSLVSGKTRSCGCLKRELSSQRATKHGMCKSSEYCIWSGILKRCNNHKAEKYATYGGRGITVCKRWLKFENFYADMGPRPSKKHSVDRFPDIDGNYCPENCRWATQKEQCNNTRKNCWIEIDGDRRTVSQWAEHMGIGRGTIVNRLVRGWSDRDAVLTPVRRLTKKVVNNG